jgi:nitrogen fixation/metabolism regulation signal transduction histidine kinase
VSLRSKFFIYLIFVHIVFCAGAVYFLWETRIWLFAVEAFFVLSLVAGSVLVKKLFEPIRLIRSGIEFIKANEFATRFREVGQRDLDPLIKVYNRMVDSLREQRIHNEEQEFFLQRIIASSPSGILALDLDGRISMANESAASLLQRDKQRLLGKRLEELDTRFAAELAKMKEDETGLIPFQGPRRVKCRALHFMDRGFARRFILMEELTEELYRSEKAAYEKLIRMMSHEVNNTTSAVNSLLESCLYYRDQIADDDRDDFARALGVAISRTGRMNEFMREFAEVVRLPEPNPQPTDLKQLIEDVVFLVKRQAEDRRIEWRWEVETDLPDVFLDPAQMEQVFLNIFKNSVEAIDEEGTITVGIGPHNGGLFVTVRDTGGGVPPDVQDHLFTPFYSSKKDGRGIGLTVVKEVLLRHGFDFRLENRDPGSAEFSIYF